MSKLAILTCAAALVLAGGVTTVRAQSDEQMSVRVSYKDLDLSQPAGQAVLNHRIHVAARTVCGPEPDFSDLAYHEIYRKCVRDAEDRATGKAREAIAKAIEARSVRLAQSEPQR